MLAQLKQNIRRLVDFNEEEIIFFLSHFNATQYKKYDKIVIRGENCRKLFYINKGLVRYYYDSPEKEYTLTIYHDDYWVTDFQAYMTGTPANVHIECLEDTEIFSVSFENMEKIFASGEKFERYGRLVVELRFLEFITKEKERKMKSPEERYLQLIDERPEIVQRAPLKHIASMLEIEPETLSRIRKRVRR